MYQVKSLHISGGDIYDMANGQLTNGRMCETQYLIMYKQINTYVHIIVTHVATYLLDDKRSIAYDWLLLRLTCSSPLHVELSS